jgi:N-acetyl sugar amidotransferase
MIYCKNCVYPTIAANLETHEDGICSSCKTYLSFNKLTGHDWNQKKKIFENLIEEIKKNNKSKSYDCVIPVSGGKDSYYQTHLIVKEYKLKPLLVTYHGNNYLPEGDYNRDQMRKVFNCDHIVFGPSVEVLKKLNILGFEKMGDMNWQNHCGIMTLPIIIAAKFKISYLFWGEIAWDISGMFQVNDYPEFSARSRHEHALRGFEWFDFINNEYNLSEQDMLWAKYPSDKEIIQSNIRGLFLGNYFKWDTYKNTQLMKDLYGWKELEQQPQRTYRKVSNLDDRYENGVHDLLKFIKFGYGRCSDHASKDIRANYMTREQAIKLVMKYDHIVSDDLNYWLKYVGKDKNYFWNLADKFRDPRVWTIKDGKWFKYNLDNSFTSYGEVYLKTEDINLFNKKKNSLKDTN